MNPDSLLWTAGIGTLLTCLTSIGARALREYSRHDLEDICQKHDQKKLFSEILRDDDRVALGVEIVASLVTAITVVAGCFWMGQRLNWLSTLSSLGFAILVVGIGALLAAVRVWIPYSVSRLAAAHFLYFTWPLWKFLCLLATPLVWGADVIDTIFHRIAGRKHEDEDEESFEEEIRTIVSEGQREGLLEEDAKEMIEGVMELGDATVSQIMTPRTDIHMVQADMPWEELVPNVIQVGHTRIPVYDKNRDDIIGVLYSKDLLPELIKEQDDIRKSWSSIVRKPVFVPETKPVDDLLQMFQQSHTHIAIVLDEYGGVAGLVTIEDVLEEIVGEIVDEYDKEVEEDIHKIDTDVCEALGRAHVDEINEVMGFQLPEDADFDTIGGFVFTELGRVPQEGEQLIWQESVQVTVLQASRRSIDRVRVEKITNQSRDIA